MHYPELWQDVTPGDTLLLDDGKIQLKVVLSEEGVINTKVVTGGALSNHKGLNLQGGGISAKALSEKDKTDITHAIKLGADYIALSFVFGGRH